MSNRLECNIQHNTQFKWIALRLSKSSHCWINEICSIRALHFNAATSQDLFANHAPKDLAHLPPHNVHWFAWKAELVIRTFCAIFRVGHVLKDLFSFCFIASTCWCGFISVSMAASNEQTDANLQLETCSLQHATERHLHRQMKSAVWQI